MNRQFIVAYVFELNPHPASNTDIRRVEVGPRRSSDQYGLHARSGRDPHRNVSVVVVVIREHGVDSLPHKEGRLAMRHFLGSLRQRATDSPHASQVFLAAGLGAFAQLFTIQSAHLRILAQTEPVSQARSNKLLCNLHHVSSVAQFRRNGKPAKPFFAVQLPVTAKYMSRAIIDTRA